MRSIVISLFSIITVFFISSLSFASDGIQKHKAMPFTDVGKIEKLAVHDNFIKTFFNHFAVFPEKKDLIVKTEKILAEKTVGKPIHFHSTKYCYFLTKQMKV